MSASAAGPPRLRTALVLSGGGARGAYEAGVVSFLREELEPGLGKVLPLDILSGTSVGAINACQVAAHAHAPHAGARALVDSWRALSVEGVLRFTTSDVLRMGRELLGRPATETARGRYGGLVEPRALEGVVARGAHWPCIGRNVRSGALQGLSVSATHVASGRTTVFIYQRGLQLPPWTRDPHVEARATVIGPKHALASAAIPLLFPAVRIGGRLYVDGGLRQNLPLSPALRLGAQRVIVVSLRHVVRTPQGPVEPESVDERTFASAPFLLGKALNALLLDRTDQDLERLLRFNAMLAAGSDAFGPGYPETLAKALVPYRNQGLRYVRTQLVSPSRDIGALAAEYVLSPEYLKAGRGVVRGMLRRLVEHEAKGPSDLASYLLFDGPFADQLIELGRADARACGDAWARFFSDAPQNAAEAAAAGVPLGA